jgi:NAD(P)H-flavin reductase
VEVQEPLGYFTLRHPERPAVFVATGTGIAPFRSILLSALPGAAPVTLLFGARHPHGLLYRQELEALAQRHPHFRFLPTVTRPGEAWQGRVGRVQAHLDAALADHAEPDVYICGLKEMVDETRALLKQKGFDRKRIIYEKYD